MNSTKCGGGYIHEIPQTDIEYIGYFYGKSGNESIKNAYSRITKLRGKAPAFFFNAELFDSANRKAASDVVCGGIPHRLTEGYGIAFPNNKKAVFSYKNNVNAKDYIGAYPTLTRNGKAETSIPSGIGGSRGRTAIGVGGENLYIVLVPDGNNDLTLPALRSALLKVGATNAINLDGGGSTQYYSPLGNHYTGRNVRGFIGIWLKETKETEETKETPKEPTKGVKEIKETVDKRTVKVRTNLRIRSKPSILGKVVGRLYNNNVVTVLEEKNGWCRISSGWVSASYLKK